MVSIQKISGFRSRVINALIDAVASNRPVGGPGLLTTSGPGGTVISLARRSSVSNSGDALPWTAEIFQDEADAWGVRFHRCGYVHGPITRVIPVSDDFTLDDPPAQGEGAYWIGVKIDTITGLLDSELLCSQTAAAVFDAAPPADKFFKRLLYTFTYTSAVADPATPASWAIKDGWYRLLPERGAYV